MAIGFDSSRYDGPELAPYGYTYYERPRTHGTGGGLRRMVKVMLIVAIAADLVADGYFFALRSVNPPATAYMLENGVSTYDYVDLADISTPMIGVTLAHEDASLPTRETGVDWNQFLARAQAYEDGIDDPYGSPIPEQLAKNLLLYPGQNWVRKGADAVLAEQVARIMPARRVLELYLNVAQFGPTLFGVCDASWYYFEKPPGQLGLDEATQLMGVLPGPIHAHRNPHGLGIDTSLRTADSRYERGKINGARRYVPRELAHNGGAVGLAHALDVASPPEDDRPAVHSCQTMPDSVARMLGSVK